MTMDVCFARNRVKFPALTLQDERLKQCDTLRLLGVYIQSDLKWNSQVDHMIRSTNSRLYVLRTLKHYHLPALDLLTVYKSFVRPVLEYAVPLWSGVLT